MLCSLPQLRKYASHPYLHTFVHFFTPPPTTINLQVWCATATRTFPRRLPRAIARAATGRAAGGEGWGAIGAGAAEAAPPSTIAVQRPQPARAGETVEQLRSRLLYVVNEYPSRTPTNQHVRQLTPRSFPASQQIVRYTPHIYIHFSTSFDCLLRLCARANTFNLHVHRLTCHAIDLHVLITFLALSVTDGPCQQTRQHHACQWSNHRHQRT